MDIIPGKKIEFGKQIHLEEILDFKIEKQKKNRGKRNGGLDGKLRKVF